MLVTGGAGFVGSVLVPLLLDKGYKVRVFDSLEYGLDPLFGCFLRKGFEFVRGDVRNQESVIATMRGCDAVIHLAGLVGFPLCKKDEKRAFDINTAGSNIVANACRRMNPSPKLLFASTGSVYGNVEGLCMEETPLHPLTIYGMTKAEAEKLMRTELSETVIYRFATGYGVSPRLRLDLLINDFCYRAIRDRNLIVYERHFRRTFIHVVDMALSFIFGLQNYERMRGETFNVGSEGLNLTKQEIAEALAKRTKFYLHYADVGHDEDKRDYGVSYAKIHRVGFRTSVSLGEGITQLLALFQDFELKPQYSNV